MADIFVSYAHVDQSRVKQIVEKLEALGFSVWWDIALRSGDRYSEVIEGELEQAKCVMAVWSRAARNSTWVKAESSIANDQEKLVQVVLQRDVKPPLPFNIIHFEPIDTPDEKDENWVQLVDAVRLRIGGQAGERAPARAPSPFNLAGVFSILSALGLGVYLAAANSPPLQIWFSANAPQIAGDPLSLPLYAAAAFGLGAALLTVKNIAAEAMAGR